MIISSLSRTRILCIGLSVLLAATASFLSAQDLSRLKFFTENFPPYNYPVGGMVEGQAVDLLRNTMARLGIRNIDIAVLPWARAYERTLREPYTVLFSTTRTPEREKLFQWVGPIATSDNVLLALKSRHIVINRLKEAGKYRIGALDFDAAEQLLLSAGVPEDSIDTGSGAVDALRKLIAGRIDLFAYDSTVAKWFAQSAGLDFGLFESVYLIGKSEHYFAFNNATPKDVVAAFSKALSAAQKGVPFQEKAQ